VDSTMLDHVEQWKTYPPRSTFNTTDPIGHKGDKVFEQPLIASQPGVKPFPRPPSVTLSQREALRNRS